MQVPRPTSLEVEIEQERESKNYEKLAEKAKELLENNNEKSVSWIDEVLNKAEAQLEEAGDFTKGAHRAQQDGHTDDKPIRPKLTKRFATNWELSVARATTVTKESAFSSSRCTRTMRSLVSPLLLTTAAVVVVAGLERLAPRSGRAR